MNKTIVKVSCILWNNEKSQTQMGSINTVLCAITSLFSFLKKKKHTHISTRGPKQGQLEWPHCWLLLLFKGWLVDNAEVHFQVQWVLGFLLQNECELLAVTSTLFRSGVSRGGPTKPGNPHAIPYCSDGVQSRPHVQNGVFGREPSVIVINNITDLLSTTIYNPVMSVKW